ncbi:MAG: SPFH domain-containing protein [Acholeplasmataceae bacterium]|nr:SPFH domain-containing protein [Acholeplasmataceae bacterium]
MEEIIIGALVLIFLTILFIAPNIKIVGINEAHVVERFGAFHKILNEKGVYFTIPLIDRVIQVVPLLETTKKFHFKIDKEGIGVQYHLEYQYKVNDVVLFVYAALDSLDAIEMHIKNLILENESINSESFAVLHETALTFGIELIDIQVK